MDVFVKFICFFFILQSKNLTKAHLYDEYEERLDTFIEGTLQMSGCDIYRDLLRIHFNDEESFCEKGIQKEIDRINGRHDGIDFSLASVGWLLQRYWDSPLLPPQLKADLVDAVTAVPLFYDESGHLGPMQFWSENHQVGWHVAEYLIGAAFAGRPELAGIIFTASGVNGSVHEERGGERLRSWMRHRLEFGFSEFNSDTYGPIAYKAVVAAAGCSPDKETRDLARMVMNLQLFDHILGSKGVKLVTPRGRAYESGKLGLHSYNHLWLIKGEGNEHAKVDGYGNAESVYFALAVLHGYKLPGVLLEVAASLRNGTHEMVERFGLGEYEEGGVVGEDAVNCTFWFGNGGYFSPVYPRCVFIVGDAYDLWNRSDTWMDIAAAKPLWDLSPSIVDIVGEIGAPFGHGPVLGPANVRTFRTGDVFVSSVQDYKGGYMAGQQHAWQATLDIYRHGTVFTTQPTSHHWEGGILPKVGQVGTTLLALYSPEVLTTLAFSVNMTHAHFRKHEYDQFDESEKTGEGSRWLVGRQGDAFVALYSWKKSQFIEEEDGTVRDLVAPGVQNVWICEVGSVFLNGTYEQFRDSIFQREVDVKVTWDNSLLECLVDNGCLSSLPQFIHCMTQVCSSFTEGDDDTTKCLNDIHEKLSVDNDTTKFLNAIHEKPPADDNTTKFLNAIHAKLPSLVQSNGKEEWIALLGSCLGGVRRSDIEVSYRREQSLMTFGWASPLVVDGRVVQADNFPRYHNQFTAMEWGQRNVTIQADTKHLFMQFDDGIIDQN